MAEYVWVEILQDPEKLSKRIDAVIENEPAGVSDPQQTYKTWTEYLSELDRRRGAFRSSMPKA